MDWKLLYQGYSFSYFITHSYKGNQIGPKISEFMTPDQKTCFSGEKTTKASLGFPNKPAEAKHRVRNDNFE